MADSYKDDGDTEMQALYENNAKNIRISMAQVQSTINRMNSASQEKTMEDMADTLTASAQNLMNSYNQMAANVAAMEKSVETAQSSYDAAVKKRSAGLIKDTELESEKSSLTRQQNSLASLKEQQSELKESLLTMLGLSGRIDVEIGTVPDPDMAAIRAVSVENDLQTAISNDSTWGSEMKSKVTGTDNRELRKQRISEAAQNAEISLRSTYENLQNAVSQYEAAESAYSAAKQAWDTVQSKQMIMDSFEVFLSMMDMMVYIRVFGEPVFDYIRIVHGKERQMFLLSGGMFRVAYAVRMQKRLPSGASRIYCGRRTVCRNRILCLRE